jgi:hypothetical protein
MISDTKGTNQVKFKWNNYDHNEGGQCTDNINYHIEYKAAGRGEAFRDGIVDSRSKSGTVTGLESCTNYVFRGRSNNPFCYSNYS